MDKYAVLRIYCKPPMYGHAMFTGVEALLFLMLLAHTVVGTYFLSVLGRDSPTGIGVTPQPSLPHVLPMRIVSGFCTLVFSAASLHTVQAYLRQKNSNNFAAVAAFPNAAVNNDSVSSNEKKEMEPVDMSMPFTKALRDGLIGPPHLVWIATSSRACTAFSRYYDTCCCCCCPGHMKLIGDTQAQPCLCCPHGSQHRRRLPPG